MILAITRMTIPPQRRGEVLKILKSMTMETRIQLGCLGSRLYRDVSEESVFMVEEIWRNQEDLDRYLRSDDYCRMLPVIKLA